MQTLAENLTSQAISPSLEKLILTLAETSIEISHAVRHGAL
ncbi:fructose-bisphosphatase class I, partial [Shewanella sp. GutDb-MelDb]